MTQPNRELARRWRLVLGRYADRQLPAAAADAALDATLGYLYDHEYVARGHRHAKGGGGSLDPSALTALTWLSQARGLFPASTLERMERDAVTRYGLDDLLSDPKTVDALEASPALAKALLRCRGKLNPATAAGVRRVIARAVADILARLRPVFSTSLTGSRLRSQRSRHASSHNFDWRRTIAANLSHVDPETGRMLVEEVRFMARQRRRNLQWQIIILVDQSGSMADSVLHSAVSAAILAGLPGLSVRLILFDTSIADVSHLAADPVEVLMTAQLGGGTDIAQALAYAAQQVRQPSRTVVALISDFEEGGSVSALLAVTRGLAASGVRLLGLASLSDEGEPWYDHGVAARLAAAGMEIAAMTPDRFAEWLAEVTQ
ncbi:MAG: VWA domain-containing protein [Propionibacteriaceae bacterium]|jgi:Mg-chelatase subunit ChlD|nr:VWA domain-containing protein [Propionibacteriaceae bacterium]